jgi:hypothetical protein
MFSLGAACLGVPSRCTGDLPAYAKRYFSGTTPTASVSNRRSKKDDGKLRAVAERRGMTFVA